MTNFDLDFTLDKMQNGDIRAFDYKKSIVTSLTNLMLFETHDLPYNNAFVGNGLRELLFELPNFVNASFINTNIEWLITQYEPRVEIVKLDVKPLIDSYEINISYKIVKFDTVESLVQVRKINGGVA